MSFSFKQFASLQEEFIQHPGTQYGSNPGGLYTHSLTGEKFYAKFPRNEEQAHVEAATSELYQTMGVDTLSPMVKHIDGKKALISKWNDKLESLRSPSDYIKAMETPGNSHRLAMMHHAAIITGNRDIIGLDYTNVMKDKTSGRLYSVDHGGSMHFRAQGETKPFGPDIDDVKSFQNPGYQSGSVFRHVPHEALKEASKHLNMLTDASIDNILRKHGLDRHASVIKARRDLLIKHYE